ncbi:hypothetical protein NEOLI_003001 [Neolecta irregularis DAH-3]|uniref:Uncharacterized protein n=1 Tax=Neolecta irregularis (strain DAH-3) TaxID=1198029 RepID=A0A1U7LNE3_NEOID|nr:hypothetical protein NEOLI_003001 [Neolecta irregularis DAH-3]|eukprot:OLL24190.1 hypothetical protein NEOLI_003001 [Neolecta irregularis DAH-3]
MVKVTPAVELDMATWVISSSRFSKLLFVMAEQAETVELPGQPQLIEPPRYWQTVPGAQARSNHEPMT